MKGGIVLTRFNTAIGLGTYGSTSITSNSTDTTVRTWLQNAVNEVAGHALNEAGASNSDTSVVIL